MAVANYVDNHDHYPPAWLCDESGRPLLSWRVLILPYIDQQPLYDQFDLNEPWDGPNNARLLGQMPPPYRLHTINDGNKSATNYVAVVGKETIWPGTEPWDRKSVVDDPSNTLLITEYVGHPIPWTKPEDLLFGQMDMTVDSDAGICSELTPPAFVTVDGLVRFLPRDTSAPDVRALLTATGDDNEEISSHNRFPSIHDGRLRPRKSN